MALSTQNQTPSNWEQRWPQQHQAPDYDMMGTSSMMAYDTRHATSTTIQPPVMTPQYVIGNTYSEAPMAAVPAPSYSSQVSFGYAPYSQQQIPAPVATTYRPQYHDQIQPRALASPTHSADRRMSYPHDSRAAYFATESSRSPSVSSGSTKRTTMVKSEPVDLSAKAKEIAPNVDQNGNLQATFNTGIDLLMKTISLKKVPEFDSRDIKGGGSPAGESAEQEPDQSKSKKVKKFVCNVAGCAGRFSQKQHLRIHIRTHTNSKPYKCKYEGCGKEVSQRGNLKTHERLHTGEKPFGCDQCGKTFAQRGNVKAHQKTHLPEKPFACMLANCDKKFGQRGNLKNHQNKFHADVLAELRAKFERIKSTDDMSPEDFNLFKHLSELYKNSNRGIKGRGSGNKVNITDRKLQHQHQQMTPPLSPDADSPMAQHSYHHQLPYHQQPQHSYTMHHQMPLPMPQHQVYQQPQHHHHHQGLSHPAAYSISNRAAPHNMMININYGNSHGIPMSRDHSGIYEVFDSESDSVMGSSTTSPTVYEEDHSRNEHISFADRMY